MSQLLPGDKVWRNLRLATLDPHIDAPYGILEHHALIIRGEKSCLLFLKPNCRPAMLIPPTLRADWLPPV